MSLTSEQIVSISTLNSMHDAHTLAYRWTAETGTPWIAVDNGPHCYPRFSVRRFFSVGDPVSFGFNGDYYPDGTVVRISASKSVITTSTGRRYYRYRHTGSWRHDNTWTLVHGHIHELNPSF